MRNPLRAVWEPGEARSGDPLGMDTWLNYFSYLGSSYPIGLNPSTTYNQSPEEAPNGFQGYVRNAYQSNGVVFACTLARMQPFAQARFGFQRMRNGQPGDLFYTPELARLETPWVNGTTADLLTRMEQDATLAGNWFGRKTPNGVERMRPDWVTIIMGSRFSDNWQPGDLGGEVAGYFYHPGGLHSNRDPVYLRPEDVAHYAPTPDPEASFRGMSWLSPVLREVMADGASTTHKLKFFENGATPNMVVSLDPSVRKQQFQEWVDIFKSEHEGYLNAYKTLFFGGGADAKVVGTDFKAMDFKSIQGKGETRIANAAGVPPIIAGLSEGLEASTYSNYAQARRAFGDTTLQYLWTQAAGALASIIPSPSDARLWFDLSGVAFLHEDVQDAATARQTDSVTIKTLIDAGYEPESVVSAVKNNNVSLLKHTGLVSVQLQEPGANAPTDAPSKPSQPALPAGKAENSDRDSERVIRALLLSRN